MGVVNIIALGPGSHKKDLHGPEAVVLTRTTPIFCYESGGPGAGHKAAFGHQQGLPTQLKP